MASPVGVPSQSAQKQANESFLREQILDNAKYIEPNTYLHIITSFDDVNCLFRAYLVKPGDKTVHGTGEPMEDRAMALESLLDWTEKIIMACIRIVMPAVTVEESVSH